MNANLCCSVRGAAAVCLALLAASPTLAQSDTAEVRSGDLVPPQASPGEATPSGQTGRLALPESPPADNLALRKEEVRANIELWEGRVRRKIADVEKVVGTLDLSQITAQKLAVSAMRDVLDELDEEAQAILAAQAAVTPDLKLYRQALLKAPELFGGIAKDLDARAGEKRSAFLKEAYADFAGEARALASVYTQKAKDIESVELEIAAKMMFVAESRDFIRDVRGLLDAIPTESGVISQKLIGRVNQYVDAFQAAITALKGVTTKLGAEAVTPPPSTPPVVRPVPLSRSPRPAVRPTPVSPAAPQPDYYKAFSSHARKHWPASSVAAPEPDYYEAFSGADLEAVFEAVEVAVPEPDYYKAFSGLRDTLTFWAK